MSKLSQSAKEEIKSVIIGYCEGINHLEFNLSDLDQMVEDISNISEIRRNAEDAFNWSWRHGDDMGK